MTDLLTRLKEATAPSRELDAEIWLATTPGATRKTTLVKSTTDKWPPYTIDETRDATGQMVVVPAFTDSIDASLALVERKLPGWGWDISSNTEFIKACMNPELGKPESKHPHWACVSNSRTKKYEDGATPALALLIALFTALQETDQ